MLHNPPAYESAKLPFLPGAQFGATPEQACLLADVIVIGSGLPAIAFVHRLLQRRFDTRVVILERGPAGPTPGASATSQLCVPGTFRILESPAVFGGGSSAWRGWSPTPRPGELADWPDAVRAGLNVHLAEARELLQIADAPWNDSSGLAGECVALLQDTVAARAGSVIGHSPLCLSTDGTAKSAPAFWQRCASMRVRARPVSICFDVEVLALGRTGDTVDELEILAQGRRRSLRLSAGQRVVLAAGCLPSTRLVWPLVERPGLEATLNGHIVSDICFELDTGGSDRTSDTVQAASAILQADLRGRAFQFQLMAASAASCATSPWAGLPPLLRNDSAFGALRAEQAILSITAIGEASGAGPEDSGHARFSVTTGPDRIRVLETAFRPSTRDEALWDDMDDILDQALHRLERFGTPTCLITQGGRRHPLSGGADLPGAASRRYSAEPAPGRRFRGLMHASGTLTMGDARNAVTDYRGRVHGLANLHAVGMATFPTAGSHNGALTAVALALRSADAIVDGY